MTPDGVCTIYITKDVAEGRRVPPVTVTKTIRLPVDEVLMALAVIGSHVVYDVSDLLQGIERLRQQVHEMVAAYEQVPHGVGK